MSYIYKIFGKLSMVFYIATLYQFWHLCQYGGTEKPCVSIGCGDSNVRMYISNMGDRQKKG